MAIKLNVGPALGGLGIGSVALSASITIQETGTVLDHVIECLQSPCSPRIYYPANGWNIIPVPVGLGVAPAGVLILPPATNYAIEVRNRAYNGTPTTTYYNVLHKNAPFLWYFDLTVGAPTNVDLYWAGRNYSARGVVGSLASPCVFTDVGHALVNGECIRFSSGTPPTGFYLNTPYYVVNTAATFNLAATPGGTAINSAGASSSLTYSTDNGFFMLWL